MSSIKNIEPTEINIVSQQEKIYIENFLEAMAAEKVASKNTLEAYRTDLLQMAIFFAIKKVPILRVQYSDITHYIQALNKEKFSVSSISHKISSIKQFFLFLLNEKIRNNNPANLLSNPKKPQCIPKALSEDNINKLLESVAQDKTEEGIRNGAMLEMLYATGMRISELVTLPIHVLEINSRTNQISNSIFVHGKGDRERMIILSEDTITKLREYLSVRAAFLKKHKQSSSWLFPSLDKNGKIIHITRQRLGQILKELALKNNMDPTILSPHKIRHSFATHMLQHGANIKVIQELLGHVSINSTQIYTKICSAQAISAMKKHPLASCDGDDNDGGDCIVVEGVDGMEEAENQ